ncbi:FAD binding domain-containing protein [Colletotrichum simmondsii]|uniref:FAD binding domain-containing protein n=1 Tax=Colletotrichum simmondsii TaxID=703756 RepID=A0A135RRC2_9PEZI|nr:FAD binding domain-containing protein [Colletotrichum simmondsii]
MAKAFLILGLMHSLPCLAQPSAVSPSTCEAIDAILPGKVAFPDTATYISSNVYWSGRQNLEPSCIVLPACAEDVSKTLGLVTKSNSPFTVRSGGHTAFDKGSNIQDGVVINMAQMNGIQISPDRSTVSVGPGARWINVTDAVTPHGIAVVGGRSPMVGISGFLLGGGMSFLTGRRGMGCDNVRNYEVVLVSGEIVNANPSKNQDLYWALRGGGGSSFGIVTRFDLEAYAQGDVWSRLSVWSANYTTAALNIFTKTVKEKLHSGQDLDSHMFFGLTYTGVATGEPIPTLYGFHMNLSSPHAPGSEFDTMKGLFQLPMPLINNTLVTDISGQIRTTSVTVFGERQSFYATSIRDGENSEGFMSSVVDAFTTFASGLRADVEARGDSLNVTMVFQPLTNPTFEAMQKNGGNALGLYPSDFPSYIVSVPMAWSDKALDDMIDVRTNQFINDLDAMARKQGFGNGFQYMNYSGKLQSVIESYGKVNQDKLRAIAAKYDPNGLLRKLWKGYFKP